MRCLTVPHLAGIATTPVLALYHQVEDDSLRWAIGNAMIALATDDVADEILRIVRDERNGRSRQMFVLSLARLHHPELLPTLVDLLSDPIVAGQAVAALGALRWRSARPAVERMLTHPNEWVRKEAKKALKRIDAATAHE